MRTFLEETVVQPALTDVRCNICGRSVSKNTSGYFEDHVSISKQWGYHSPYDGETHIIDVCVDCYQDWAASFDIPPKQLCTCYGTGDALCMCSW